MSDKLRVVRYGVVLTIGFATLIAVALVNQQTSATIGNGNTGNSEKGFNVASSKGFYGSTSYPILNITAAQLEKGIYMLKNGHTTDALKQLQAAANGLKSLSSSGAPRMGNVTNSSSVTNLTTH